MSKTVSVLYLFLILIMMGAIGFLGLQVSKLNDLYYAVQNGEQETRVDADQVTKTIAALKTKVKAQDDIMQEFSASLTKLSLDFKSKPSTTEYMPAFKVAVSQALFQSQAKTGRVSVIGDKNRISKWQEQNGPFLEYLLKKSLPLQYNRQTRNVDIQDMVKGSVFYQMGLRSGDGIVSVGGKKLTRGMDIREALMSPKSKAVWVLRKGRRVKISIDYADQLQNELNLKISKNQFDQALPTLMDSANVVPALLDNGQVMGVKIVELQPESVLTMLNLKAHDVITKIDGRVVTSSELVSHFQTTKDDLNIEYLRNGQQDQIKVTFRP